VRKRTNGDREGVGMGLNEEGRVGTRKKKYEKLYIRS